MFSKYILVFLMLIFSSICFAQEATKEPVAVKEVTVAEPAAPPKWVEQVVVAIQEIPVVGPVITKVINFLVTLFAILTAVTAFLYSVLTALMKVSSMARLVALADWLQRVRAGRVMYWISLLSNIPLKKPESLKQSEEKRAA